MEQYAHKDLTLRIFRAVLDEPEFRDWPDVGIVVQAYLPEAEADLRDAPRLGRAARDAGHGPAGQGGVLGLRGPASPAQLGWPVPVYLREVADRRQLRALHAVPDGAPRAAPAGVRQPQRPQPRARDGGGRGAAACRATATRSRCSTAWASRSSGPLVGRGQRVRVYTPYGAMLPGMAYLVRRLLENTSNESFLKASFAERRRVDDLLRNPEEIGAMWQPNATAEAAAAAPAAELPPFRNEPLTDFTRAETREAMRRRSSDVRGPARPDAIRS